MKDVVTLRIREARSALEGRNLLREYLQARILECLQRAGAMLPLAFHGGTALRFLFAIPRYSEDLDFALEGARDRYDFRGYLRAIRSQFEREDYQTTVKLSDQKVVHSAFVRFPGLLHELGLSPHRDETIAVKLEVDTHPPEGAGLVTTIVRRHVALNLHYHDRASLLAGKLHAVLSRPYFKGRDVYDLFWYLSDLEWPEPNLTLLNNALTQTGWEGGPLDLDSWRAAVRRRIESQPWERVATDVAPFIERDADLDLLTRENLLGLCDRRPWR